jgi:hypothetical protein
MRCNDEKMARDWMADLLGYIDRLENVLGSRLTCDRVHVPDSRDGDGIHPLLSDIAFAKDRLHLICCKLDSERRDSNVVVQDKKVG